jgi:hypothetical protein
MNKQRWDLVAITCIVASSYFLITDSERPFEVVVDKLDATVYNQEDDIWRPGFMQYKVESPDSPIYIGDISVSVPPRSEVKLNLPFVYVKYDNYLTEHKVSLMVDNQPFYETVVMR